MQEIDKLLPALLREHAVLDRKFVRILYLKFGLQMLGAVMLGFSALVWGGFPMGMVGLGLFLIAFQLPKEPESGPEIEAIRTLREQILELKKLKAAIADKQISQQQANSIVERILKQRSSSSV